MNISQNKSFHPVTITLETEKELTDLVEALRQVPQSYKQHTVTCLQKWLEEILVQ